MKQIKQQLEKITDVWNNYILDLRFFQDRIAFTTDVKSNYFGDILHYFVDTFDLLIIKKSRSFGTHIFNAVGLLQIIYVQQDMLDELLYIFRLPKSTAADKNPNRSIRNELIGHPIRRTKLNNEFISSVFFGKQLSDKTIHYILYAKDSNFAGQDHCYTKASIIDRHKVFLRKYFGLINKKIDVLLSTYKKRLLSIQIMIEKKVSFPNIVKLTSQAFEKILKDNYLFKKEILLECYNRREDHPRYKLVTELFIKTLSIYLKETIEDIDDLLTRSRNKVKLTAAVNFDVKIIAKPDNNGMKETKNTQRPYKLHYELGKLHEKHPVFGIDFFKQTYASNPKVLQELLNMEANMTNDLEYHSSYEYIKNLLQVE